MLRKFTSWIGGLFGRRPESPGIVDENGNFVMEFADEEEEEGGEFLSLSAPLCNRTYLKVPR